MLFVLFEQSIIQIIQTVYIQQQQVIYFIFSYQVGPFGRMKNYSLPSLHTHPGYRRLCRLCRLSPLSNRQQGLLGGWLGKKQKLNYII